MLKIRTNRRTIKLKAKPYITSAVANYTNAMNDPHSEYLRYVAVLDKNTRDNHAALHNVILPKDHPFWEKNYPPNGWNCRCKAIAVTKEFLDRHGLKPTKDLPEFKAHPDWNYNVGKTDKLESYYNERIQDLSHPEQTAQNLSEQMQRLFNNLNAALVREQKNFKHARDLSVWQAGLNHAIDELIVKNNIKAPIEVFQVGELKADLKATIESLLGKALTSSYICANKHGILHVRPARKGPYNQALRIDELRQIVRVLDEAKEVSVDKKSGSIIFWFEDKKDQTKINKIAVSVDYNLKKFGVSNYVITVGKVEKADKKEKHYTHIR